MRKAQKKVKPSTFVLFAVTVILALPGILCTDVGL